ncbi:sensor histidine kinase [Asticcacaulis tiandongensis]|uniref:sensor histidine kinase n=1 Tax=Asticcacaulis tiandongensis TaxID=2565365 RepID=UPI00112C0A53|nr:ATP-binding protein [Asticcacaulis tiandongensis]
MSHQPPPPPEIKPLPAPPSAPGSIATADVPGSASRTRGAWVNLSNLKFEATIFLLIVLTFAAVLGQEGFTSQEIDLAERSLQYYPFTYDDQHEGGTTSVIHDLKKPFNWTCHLGAEIQHPFCGYGMQTDGLENNKGVDYSKYSDIRLDLTYNGVGDHMRLLIQSTVPPALKDRVKDRDTIPMVAEFIVVQGNNTIHIKASQFVVEEWWLLEQNLSRDEVPVRFDQVASVALGSGSITPSGRFDVSVKRFSFSGMTISTAHWYLIILGIWLVATGAFLVFRFFYMRRTYEARQRRQANEAAALAKAHAAAEASSAAKSRFLANMSHELRTPLNAILGYTQLLQNEKLTINQIAAVNTIHHSGEHLLAMITDILDIAKVEAGRLELVPVRFDLHACVLNVGQMIRLRAEEKGLQFVTHIADDVPRFVVADQKRVRQILINLLSNAIKFTLEGAVNLKVSARDIHRDHVRLCFEVTDTGIGIHRDHLDEIFRPFVQSGNAIDRSSGTGLGLSITHQIAVMMGGKISVESQLGQGSRFRMDARFELAVDELPQTSDDSQALSPKAENHAPLIVPDAEQMMRLLELARAGNLRAIRKEIPIIIAKGQEYHAFASRLDALAASYQSPAVLRLIEQYAQERTAV